MKKLTLKLSNCISCPYNKYDQYYDCSRNSGWDCTHPQIENKRIVEETASNYIEAQKELKKNQNQMFKYFSDWCPLPENN